MINFKSNFERGVRYYWMPAATMACVHIGGVAKSMKLKYVPLWLEKPKDGFDYHRVKIEVVRTQRELNALQRKWAKIRATAQKVPT